MRLSTPVRRRRRSRSQTGEAGRPVRLRLAAGLVGLAMVGSLGIGSMASAQAEDAPLETGVATTSGATESPEAADDAAGPKNPAAGGEETPAGDPDAGGEGTVPAAGLDIDAPAARQPDGDGAGAAPDGPAVPDLAAPGRQMLAAAPAKGNPVLPNKCGLNMAVVLDLSNSLSNSDVTASKNAAKSVVDTLRGTPSAVGVYTFGTFAPDRTNAAMAKTSVSTANNADAVRTSIGNIQRVPSNVGGTNWDAALRQIPSAQYDIVLFVTDGNPTAYGTPGTGNNSDYGEKFDAIDLSTAVTAADALKASSTFVMGLGVGSGVNIANIQAISGTRSGTDYFQIGDYDKLTAKLKEIVLKNCQGTVSIVKQVRDLDGTMSPAAGWTFDSQTADNVSPASAVTGNDGAVNFRVNDLPAAGRVVQFAELQQAGYALEAQEGSNATCVNNSTGKSVPTTNAGKLGFTLAVKPADAISCRVINAKLRAQVKVTKTWVDPVDGDKASFTANDKTGDSTAPANGEVITATFAQGTTVEVAEVLASTNKGLYTAALKCTTAAGATLVEDTLKGTFVLGDSNVTCAYTNTNTAATVVVEKKWIVDGTAYDNGQQPAGITAALTLTGPDAADATSQEWGEPRTGYPAGKTVSIAETTTFASGMSCELTGSALTLANGTTTSEPVPYTATLATGTNSFTVTNTVECTTALTLLKFIDGGNGGTLVPGDFTLTATPESGEAWGVEGAETVGAGNTRPVTAGVNYTISESSEGKGDYAYLQLSLQRYTGAMNPDGSLADAEAWEDAASPTVAVAIGQHEVYRFVNASAPRMSLPLTGGTGSTAYLLIGGAFLLLALLVTAWILVRRGRVNRA